MEMLYQQVSANSKEVSSIYRSQLIPYMKIQE